jgi:hypothetical protein
LKLGPSDAPSEARRAFFSVSCQRRGCTDQQNQTDEGKDSADHQCKADGVHTLRIVVLGEERRAADGTLVSIDRFIVLG